MFLLRSLSAREIKIRFKLYSSNLTVVETIVRYCHRIWTMDILCYEPPRTCTWFCQNNNSCILLSYSVVVKKMLKFGSYIYLNNAIFQPSQVLFFHIIEFLKQRSAWNVSVFGVILVCIFPHSVFIPNAGKCGPE